MTKKKPRTSNDIQGFQRTAATYSPNWWVSTIGVGELNFSVRNGKRWFLTAITTAVCYLREKTLSVTFRCIAQIEFASFLGLSFS